MLQNQVVQLFFFFFFWLRIRLFSFLITKRDVMNTSPSNNVHAFFVFFNPTDKGYESTCYFSRECTVFLSKASQYAYYIWINAIMYGPLIITLISTSSGFGVLNISLSLSLSLSQNIVLDYGYFSQPLSLIIQVYSHIYSTSIFFYFFFLQERIFILI